jgi:hypothetical protein
LQVLTAYARECERAGVRIPRWRESTGCRHVIPFKYSGEHVTSGELGGQTAHANAAYNEVLNMDEGAEQLDDYDEEPLHMDDMTRRKEVSSSSVMGGGVGSAMPAHRPAVLVAANTRPELATEAAAVERLKTSTEEKPKDGDSRRSQRKRQRRMRRLKRQKQKKEKERRKKKEKAGLSHAQGRGGTGRKTPGDEISAATIGTFNGVLVQRVPAGGSGEDGEPVVRNKLRWGGRARGDESPPPFELLLAAEDESPRSAEEDEDDEDEDEAEDEVDLVEERYSTFTDPGGTNEHHRRDGDASAIAKQRPKIDISDKVTAALAREKPAAEGRTPIPLLDSGEVISHRRFRRRRSESSSDVVNRRNWKRRRWSNISGGE